MSGRRSDFDTGRIWIAYEVVGSVVAAAALLLAAGLLLGSVLVEIDPGRIQRGTTTTSLMASATRSPPSGAPHR